MDIHTYHLRGYADEHQALDLTDATFIGQDWGGLIGLRVVAENERFARVAIANTGLPNPQTDQVPGGAFVNWKT